MPQGSVGLLASVRSASEALLALPHVDLIDAKEPDQGALGAVAGSTLRDIVVQVAARRPVSATCGDLPLDAAVLAPAMQRVADSGVDYVKVGFFGPLQPVALQRVLQALPALRAASPGRLPAQRIAVLMADQGGAEVELSPFAAAGFAGVMLDTAGKHGGRLTDWVELASLQRFLGRARELGLLTGLAGSLRSSDVACLAGLPDLDYLGFRGALCAAGARTGELSRERLLALRACFVAAGQAAAACAMDGRSTR